MPFTVGDLARPTGVTVRALHDLRRAGGPDGAGVAVGDPRVQALVEQHRLHIDRWFYPCSVAMHKTLGPMYAADPRFAANLDKTGPGFAQYLSDAIGAS